MTPTLYFRARVFLLWTYLPNVFLVPSEIAWVDLFARVRRAHVGVPLGYHPSLYGPPPYKELGRRPRKIFFDPYGIRWEKVPPPYKDPPLQGTLGGQTARSQTHIGGGGTPVRGLLLAPPLTPSPVAVVGRAVVRPAVHQL